MYTDAYFSVSFYKVVCLLFHYIKLYLTASIYSCICGPLYPLTQQSISLYPFYINHITSFESEFKLCRVELYVFVDSYLLESEFKLCCVEQEFKDELGIVAAVLVHLVLQLAALLTTLCTCRHQPHL